MANTQKTAIVTGASQGIGAGLVEAFLKRGYSVVANSRNITKANPFPTYANLVLVDGDIGNAQTAATSPFLLDVSTTIAISDSHASAPRLISILCQCIRRWGRRVQRISVPQL